MKLTPEQIARIQRQLSDHWAREAFRLGCYDPNGASTADAVGPPRRPERYVAKPGDWRTWITA